MVAVQTPCFSEFVGLKSTSIIAILLNLGDLAQILEAACLSSPWYSCRTADLL